MQELNHSDIEKYVCGNLLLSEGFRELQLLAPTKAEMLLHQILKKAEGVFIWVSLVVRSLLDLLEKGSSLSELQSNLDKLPTDILSLYQSIWSSIEPCDVTKTSEYLRLVVASIAPLTARDLWLVDERKSVDFEISSLGEEAESHISDIMKRRLVSRTKGILEVSADQKVGFLHQTVKEWITRENVWKDICSKSLDFDPYLALLRIEIIRFAHPVREPHEPINKNANQKFWASVVLCLSYAGNLDTLAVGGQTVVDLMDAVDKKAGRIARAECICPPYQHQRQPSPGISFPHWSHDFVLHAENNASFLGLAAQFALLPYIQAKILSKGSLEKPQDLTTTLIIAVFGWKWRLFKGDADYPIARKFEVDYGDIDLQPERRLKCVRFLPEQGANPRSALGLNYPSSDSYQVSVLQQFAWVNLSEKQYWMEVAALLKEFDNWKSRSRRMKKKILALVF